MVLLAPLSFVSKAEELKGKKKERKEGLGDGIEDEAHIWVIGNDRPGIIHPDNRRSKKMEGGESGVGGLKPNRVCNEVKCMMEV